MLTRLLFELWAQACYLHRALEEFRSDADVTRLAAVVNPVFEGTRSEVLLPWGKPAGGKAVWVGKAMEALAAIDANAPREYAQLCESAHANFPRYMEWWILGPSIDNWANPVAWERGHALVSKTVESMECAVIGLSREVLKGLRLATELYERR